jgi:hypothetical protein
MFCQDTVAVFLHDDSGLHQGLVAHPGVQYISKPFVLGCTKLHQLQTEMSTSPTLQTQVHSQEGATINQGWSCWWQWASNSLLS